MKTFVLVLPFLANEEVWVVLEKRRQASMPITPEPPEPKEEPGEPEREYPFWTYFIDNPCPNTRTGIH
jgi:hypothetical protein